MRGGINSLCPSLGSRARDAVVCAQRPANGDVCGALFAICSRYGVVASSAYAGYLVRGRMKMSVECERV